MRKYRGDDWLIEFDLWAENTAKVRTPLPLAVWTTVRSSLRVRGWDQGSALWSGSLGSGVAVIEQSAIRTRVRVSIPRAVTALCALRYHSVDLEVEEGNVRTTPIVAIIDVRRDVSL